MNAENIRSTLENLYYHGIFRKTKSVGRLVERVSRRRRATGHGANVSLGPYTRDLDSAPAIGRLTTVVNNPEQALGGWSRACERVWARQRNVGRRTETALNIPRQPQRVFHGHSATDVPF